GDEAQQGGLAGTIGADQRDALGLPHPQGDVTQQGPAVGEPVVDAGDVEMCHASRCTSSGSGRQVIFICAEAPTGDGRKSRGATVFTTAGAAPAGRQTPHRARSGACLDATPVRRASDQKGPDAASPSLRHAVRRPARSPVRRRTTAGGAPRSRPPDALPRASCRSAPWSRSPTPTLPTP